jgi:hypothetical protein
MPPIFIACGQENLTDEAYYLAQKAAQAGTTIRFSHYDALPHNFPIFFPKLPQSRHMLEQWGSFCRDVVRNPKVLKSEWVRYAVDDSKFQGTGLELPVSLDEEDRKKRMQQKIANRKPWTGPMETALL